MARGILGFRRLSSIGPLTYSADVDGTDDIEEVLVDIFDERGIEQDTVLSPEEFNDIIDEMTDRIYPDGGEVFNTPIGEVSEKKIFEDCLRSRWVNLWEEGFTEATTGQAEVFEELIIRTNGCTGIAEAGELGMRVLVSTQ